jgi:peptide/nickel transport system ATP-binding protein
VVASVSDLHVTFTRAGQRVHAVRGVDLQVEAGEILGLVGESGSGKSVLGMSLLGLLPGTAEVAGRAVVHGVDMVSAPPAHRRAVRRSQLGAIFQDPMTSLNPTMRIGRQVAEAAGSGAEAVRLLTAVGIPDARGRLSSFPHELSGGLRQRVMIAMAIAGGPSLVLADEPTTALDVTVQAQVLRLIRRLRDEVGCAFVLITHDLGVAAQVADRVAVMYCGRLAEVGPTGTVLGQAAHPYAHGLLRARLSLRTDRERPLTALPGQVPSPVTPPAGCAFGSRCPLVHDECGERPPPVTEVGPGHGSACLLPPDAVRSGLAGPGWVLPGQAAAPAEAIEPVAAPEDPAGAPPAVSVTDVVKTFHLGGGFGRRRALQALRGVDLTVARGEAVAIVGESGSGKSTLLRVIAGLERAQGSVELGSAAGAQMVFQDAGASLTPWLSVGELVGERLRGKGMSSRERAERVETALRHAGLPAEVAGAKARQLSGGQRQRVALARATVVPPEVLLCDEPTSALDVSLAASVINLIGRLRTELGMAVVFVTHDLAVARVVADRIAVMYCGRIVEVGSPDDITHRPRHPYTQALVDAVPDVGVQPPVLRGEPPSPMAPPPGCTYHPRCPIAIDACADAELLPRLTRATGDATRLVACIRADRD